MGGEREREYIYIYRAIIGWQRKMASGLLRAALATLFLASLFHPLLLLQLQLLLRSLLLPSSPK